MKVCVIGVYFGNYPVYMDLWLQSCAFNKEVDFFVFGDRELLNLPDNVRYIPMTLPELKSRIEEKIGRQIVLERPHKCCDFKPLYGLVFSEYITAYDYWGYCDFDILFGDIMGFLAKYEVEKYDKFLPLGHLCFMRNSKEICRLSLQGEDFEKTCTTGITTQFDELGGINRLIEEGGYRMFKKRIVADVSIWWNRIKISEPYDGHVDKDYNHQIFYWNQGRVLRTFWEKGQMDTEEFLYIHIKQRTYPAPINGNKSVRTVYVTPRKLICSDEEIPAITKKMICSYNRYYGRLYEALEARLLWKVRRRIQKVKKRLFK